MRVRKKNHNTDFDSAYPAEDIVTHVADSVPDEKNEPQEDEDSEEPVWGTNSFSSAQDAINYMNSSADASKYSAGIFHHMAGENLPYLTKLLNSPYKRFIVVDKDIMRVTLFDKYGREQLSYGMACAKITVQNTGKLIQELRKDFSVPKVYTTVLTGYLQMMTAIHLRQKVSSVRDSYVLKLLLQRR